MSIFLIVGVALILDAVLGEPGWLWKRLPHPAVLMGQGVAWGDARLNNRTQIRGIFLVGLLVLSSAIIGLFISLAGGIVESIVIAILLAQRSLVQHVARVGADLRLSLASARKSVGMIVSRDTSHATQQDVARAAIESGAENLSDGVIAPVFWALIGGVPGILVYKVVNTADSMIGYRTPKHEQFGWAAARLDDVLNWIPARLTAALFWIVGGLHGQWDDIQQDARRHKSPNAGWPEAALSRALGIALAGPRTYHGTVQDLPWVNHTGNTQIGSAEIDSAIDQLWLAWGLVVVVCFGAAFVT
ncbi:MAG: adenosylcobinamide-phosphate synthase CbiB [Pseudomonadota bacterium]